MVQTRFPNRILPFLLLAPMVVIVIIFFLYPSAQSLYMSVFRVSPLGDRKLFVGLENFTRLLSSKDYLNSLLVSVRFAGIVVLGGLSASLVSAVIANQRLRGFAVYRAFMIWPYALSPAVAGLVWGLMMNPNFGLGAVLLKRFTGINFNYLTNATSALLFLALAAMWKMFGYNIIFFLAGLQGLPTELLEAASLDGAGAWTTGGGPGQATNLLVFNLYKDGFIAMNVGYASAQSILLLIMVGSLTILQFRYAGEKVHYQ